MKKALFFVAALVLAASVNAQHVEKINLQLKSYRLDTLRVHYVNNPSGMLTELQYIQAAQKEDDKTLKAIAKELKQENDYAQSMGKYAKTAASNFKSIEKGYTNEQKSLKKMRDVAADQ